MKVRLTEGRRVEIHSVLFRTKGFKLIFFFWTTVRKKFMSWFKSNTEAEASWKEVAVRLEEKPKRPGPLSRAAANGDIKHINRVSHRNSSPRWSHCALQAFWWETSLFTRLVESFRWSCDGQLIIRKRAARQERLVIDCSNLSVSPSFYSHSFSPRSLRLCREKKSIQHSNSVLAANLLQLYRWDLKY